MWKARNERCQGRFGYACGTAGLGGAQSGALREPEGVAQGRDTSKALDRLSGHRPHRGSEPELLRLGDAALGVADVAELAGQPNLAEARQGALAGTARARSG